MSLSINTLTMLPFHFSENFQPEDRQCYKQFENNLTYFPYEKGYRYTASHLEFKTCWFLFPSKIYEIQHISLCRYEMNNCLLQQAIMKIIWDCHCKPSFHDCQNCSGFPGPDLPFCTGRGLKCLQSKLSSMAIGEFSSVYYMYILDVIGFLID